MSYTIVDATEDHARSMVPHMRKADVDEVLASGFFSAKTALLWSLRASLIARSALDDDSGAVICMWGVVPESLAGGRAIIWMLGTDRIERIAKSFVRESRAQVADFRALFPTLHNLVDTRYDQAIRWMGRIGFLPQEEIVQGGVVFRNYSTPHDM